MDKIRLARTALRLVNLKAKQERRFNNAGLIESYKRTFKAFEWKGRVRRGFDDR